jgi:signal transduction histidine kinase
MDPPEPLPLRLILVEDSEHDALAFRRAFQKSQTPCQIVVCSRAEEALAQLQAGTTSFDLVVTDHNLPGMSGLELCHELLNRQFPLPLVLLTGAGTERLAVEALKTGVDDYLIKDPDQGYLELLPVVLPEVVRRHADRLARRRAEEALRQHAAELQARNEELNAFAHTVAHDLKSPLGLIIGFAELLAMDHATMSTNQVEEYLQFIARSGHKMNNIIKELLLLASARQQEVKLQPLDMASIVAEAQLRLADQIAETQAEIILLDAPAWPVALGYGPWVEEVWVNYLSNGLKYGGQPPRLELGATIEQSSSEISPARPGEGKISEVFPSVSIPLVRFWVRDNGPGLSPEEQSRLFTPFARLDQLEVKGHGLGLSIVRRIVEKLGGQVGVESEGTPGRGSIFSFTLPAKTQE